MRIYDVKANFQRLLKCYQEADNGPGDHDRHRDRLDLSDDASRTQVILHTGWFCPSSVLERVQDASGEVRLTETRETTMDDMPIEVVRVSRSGGTYEGDRLVRDPAVLFEPGSVSMQPLSTEEAQREFLSLDAHFPRS